MKSFHTDTPDQYKWNMLEIYPSDDELQKDKQKINQLSNELLTLSSENIIPGNLLYAMKLRDEILTIGLKIGNYGCLRDIMDVADESAAKALQEGTEFYNNSLLTVAKFDVYLLSIEDQLPSYMDIEPDLKQYSFHFQNLYRKKLHCLDSPKEEALVRELEGTLLLYGNIHDKLWKKDAVFKDYVDNKGIAHKDAENNPIKMNQNFFNLSLLCPDRAQREAAYTELHRVANNFGATLSTTYNSYVSTDVKIARHRKYNTALEAALDADGLPVSLYETLVQQIRDHLPLLHEYYDIKRKRLGLDKIHLYDISAPIANDEVRYPYEEAKKIVLNALTPLGPECAAVLAHAFNNRWIDVFTRPNKKAVNCHNGIYGVHPFVNINFNPEGGFPGTLAHELGHALHYHFSSSNLPYSVHKYSTLTAETASTVNEILICEYLLGLDNNEHRIALADKLLANMSKVLFLTTMYSEFEKNAYDHSEKGKSLTASVLSDIWVGVHKQYLEPYVEVDNSIGHGWVRFNAVYYQRFYMFKYGLGVTAANVMAASLMTKTEQAQQQYMTFLKSGGNDYPLNILRSAGADLLTPEPMKLVFDRFKMLLNILKE